MSREIRYTCPDINKIILGIKSARRNAEYGFKKCQQNEGGDEFNEIINDLYRLEDILEEVRGANIQLRQRGDYLEGELSRIQENTNK